MTGWDIGGAGDCEFFSVTLPTERLRFEELEANPRILRPNERVLDLPNRPITWAENKAGLEIAIKEGKPIRDASPTAKRGYLQRERGYRMQNGWNFDLKTGNWNPPRK